MHHFPDIIEGERHEEIKAQYIESVPHKLPDLSNKYRKYLKESSSDEFEPKPILPKEFNDNHTELEQKLKVMKETEINKNYTYVFSPSQYSRLHNSYYLFLKKYTNLKYRRNEKDVHPPNANRSRSLLNRYSLTP